MCTQSVSHCVVVVRLFPGTRLLNNKPVSYKDACRRVPDCCDSMPYGRHQQACRGSVWVSVVAHRTVDRRRFSRAPIMGSLYLVQKRIIMNMKQNAHTDTHKGIRERSAYTEIPM